jgi:tRNA modification GTPase
MTHVALLTPLAQGAIATVQLVGSDAFRLAQDVFRPVRQTGPAWPGCDGIVYGQVHDHGQIIDQVVLAAHQLPDGRQVVDIHLHGGIRVVQRLIVALRQRGAQLADGSSQSADVWSTGGGLIDREALEALASAKTRRVVHWLAGQRLLLPSHLARLRQELSAKGADLPAIATVLRAIADRHRPARLLVEGAKLVIIGLPNVGKSTLANRLVSRPASIVSGRPGTTRDWVWQVAAIDGFPVTVVDTAGLGRTGDPLHVASAKAALTQAGSADLRIFLFDAGVAFDSPQGALARAVMALGPTTLVLNKIDLPARKSATEVQDALDRPVLAISALRGTGLAELGQAVIRALGLDEIALPSPCAFSPRQAQLLAATADALGNGTGAAATILSELIGSTDR